MAWPIGEIQHGTYHWLLREVSGHVGWGHNFRKLSHEQQGQIASAVQSGVLRAYFPEPVGGGESHQWSFLTPVSTLDLASGTGVYDLPEDFSGMLGEFTVTSNDESTRIPIVPEARIRQLLTSAPKSGLPRYAAVRPNGSADGQRHEVVFYPTPDSAVSVEYRYTIVPGELSDARAKLYGGRQFAELILESCLAVAEDRITKQAGTAAVRFEKRLAAAINVDKQSLSSTSKTIWPMDEAEYGTYPWFLQEVSDYAGYGPNYRDLTHDQAGKIASIVKSGVARVYYPEPIGEGASPHQWTFLTPVASLELTAGVAQYDLPADCSGVVGELTAVSGEDTTRIPIIPEPQLRQMAGASPASGVPRYAAVRPKISGGNSLHEIVLYPTPEAAATYQYRYSVVPPALSDDNPRPYGGRQFAEMMLESCFALVDDRILKAPSGAIERFRTRLAAAIQLDVQSLSPTESEVWEVVEDGVALSVTKAYLRRLIGREFGYGANPSSWTHKQQKDVQYALDTGLRQFYNPNVLAGDRTAHKWSFLIPRAMLTTVSGQSEYDLPEDFAMFDGPLLYAPDSQIIYPPIDLVSEQEVVYRLQRNESAYRPQLAATRVKAVEGGGATRQELVVWPVPDGAYEITYRYRLDPQGLPNDAALPHGGPAHAQTVIDSCLAAVEVAKGGAGPHTERFAVRLATSIAQDREIAAPDRLGQNQDTSDRIIFDRFADYHGCDANIITYNGQVW